MSDVMREVGLRFLNNSQERGWPKGKHAVLISWSHADAWQRRSHDDPELSPRRHFHINQSTIFLEPPGRYNKIQAVVKV